MRNDGAGAAPRSIWPRSLRCQQTLLVWGCLLGLGLAPAVLGEVRNPFTAKFPFATGERVEVDGILTDAVGKPLADVEIVLEMAKMRISLRPPGREKANIARGATASDGDGNFALQWDWIPGFDRFEIIAAVTVPEPTGKHLQVLQRLDITDRVRQGTPISVPFVVEDTTFLDSVRTFQSHLDSPDEHRVYEGMGRPDRIDSDDEVGRNETTWWYFALGKAYRFDRGRLVKVEDFEPVPAI
ncbi:MAG: hypothetical protein K8J08_08615 [Thermoanaerobaculia bacterium]|nr:hypothetical protein [Thermoanaerobaculia bacterium]